MSTTEKAARITPNPAPQATMDSIRSEMDEHAALAQHHYEQALALQADAVERYDSGASWQWTMAQAQFAMDRAKIEQNAAILCQGEINFMGVSILMWMMAGDDDDEDTEAETPGGLAS